MRVSTRRSQTACSWSESRHRMSNDKSKTPPANPPRTLPLVPIKSMVLYPHLMMPLAVGRPQSVAAVQQAAATEEKQVIIVTQRDATVEQPKSEDLHAVGTLAVIRKLSKAD